MAQTPEGKVKAAIKAFLKSLAPRCWFFMPIGGPYATVGIPDIVGCYGGLFFAIEVKAKGKSANTTPLQRIVIDQIRAAGGLAFVADDVEDVKPWFEQSVAARHPVKG